MLAMYFLTLKFYRQSHTKALRIPNLFLAFPNREYHRIIWSKQSVLKPRTKKWITSKKTKRKQCLKFVRYLTVYRGFLLFNKMHLFSLNISRSSFFCVYFLSKTFSGSNVIKITTFWNNICIKIAVITSLYAYNQKVFWYWNWMFCGTDIFFRYPTVYWVLSLFNVLIENFSRSF